MIRALFAAVLLGGCIPAESDVSPPLAYRLLPINASHFMVTVVCRGCYEAEAYEALVRHAAAQVTQAGFRFFTVDSERKPETESTTHARARGALFGDTTVWDSSSWRSKTVAESIVVHVVSSPTDGDLVFDVQAIVQSQKGQQ